MFMRNNFFFTKGSGREVVEANQELLREFFTTVRPYIHPRGGEVHVSLRPTTFYVCKHLVLLPTIITIMAMLKQRKRQPV